VGGGRGSYYSTWGLYDLNLEDRQVFAVAVAVAVAVAAAVATVLLLLQDSQLRRVRKSQQFSPLRVVKTQAAMPKNVKSATPQQEDQASNEYKQISLIQKITCLLL